MEEYYSARTYVFVPTETPDMTNELLGMRIVKGDSRLNLREVDGEKDVEEQLIKYADLFIKEEEL